MINRFLCFFALYFGLGFASPLLVMLANKEDIAFSPLGFSVVALTFVLALSAGSYFFSLKSRHARVIAIASLASAFVFAIQGNVIHDLFYYGNFDGSRVDWRHYGWKFWVELAGFLLALPLFYWLLSRFRQIPAWLALIPVFSSLLLIAPALFSQQDNAALGLSDDDVSPEVYEFSSTLNLVHLLPDGLQGDVARKVLEDHPELAAKLKGFTLYRDHLGMYQGTAPSVATIFMGRPYDFKAGQNWQRIMDELKLYAYPARLLENGYRLDYVSLSSPYCLKGTSSCILRPFNDMKPRGYYRHKDARYSYAIRQLFDLALFRHLPMFLKEQVYNDGNWFLADTTVDGSSPWPDPVLREWTGNMQVAGPQPRYKWYHYIGTHIPPHWDAECNHHRDLERNRQQYYDQTVCIFSGITRFLDRLRELDIYDQTAIIISGDHGINIEPDDRTGLVSNGSLYPGLIGASRPALLVKPLANNNEFSISNSPTSLLDIAPTALDLIGVEAEYPGQSVLDIKDNLERTRYFYSYTVAEYWSGEAISYDTWEVNGPIGNMENWTLTDLFHKNLAPANYAAINYATASATSRGLSLNRARPNEKSAWIGGSEFSILVGSDKPGLRATIVLSMLLPTLMDADTQSFTVIVNKHPLEEIYSFKRSKEWTSVEVPVPAGLLVAGNNLVTVKFDETATREDRKYWHSAGKLKSFSLIQ